jgi:hypothetical protein
VPAAYTIDPNQRVVYSRAWGILTDGDLLGHQSRLKADPAFDPSFNQLFDFRTVTEARLTSDGVHHLARRNAFGLHSRRAFVVLSPEMYGMMRMFEILTSDDPDELRVQFSDLAEAYRWLGITDDNGSAA